MRFVPELPPYTSITMTKSVHKQFRFPELDINIFPELDINISMQEGVASRQSDAHAHDADGDAAMQDGSHESFMNAADFEQHLRPWLTESQFDDDVYMRRVQYAGAPAYLSEAGSLLESQGVVDGRLPGPAEGTLKNPIMGLLSRDKWLEAFSDETWAEIVPALQLASLIMTENACQGPFKRFLYGQVMEEIFEDGTGRQYLEYDPDEDDFGPTWKGWALRDEKDKDDSHRHVQHEFEKLSSRLRGTFGAFDPAKFGESQTRGVHCVDRGFFGNAILLSKGAVLPGEDNGRHHTIVINANHLYYFMQSQKLRSPCSDVRTRWNLATTIVHETAHAFFARNYYGKEQDYREPCYDYFQNEPELGYGVEIELFSARLMCSSDAVKGSTTEISPRVQVKIEDGNLVSGRSSLVFPIDTSWMYRLFTEDRWTQI
ncbi:hypothetical protein EJ04DRAFT_577121 [Polyplosphaeria fusca]|uniref:Uncharacterized protein n=1 Tax=Polyplosphaeria fusca TaxID=682080 RepID=A0A9P4QZJ4_9PLEO|nr:hypothetical protein EJ04DRAFT_577121 [Polyplosphaeria fusca]